jgi:hypothetical protein
VDVLFGQGMAGDIDRAYSNNVHTMYALSHVQDAALKVTLDCLSSRETKTMVTLSISTTPGGHMTPSEHMKVKFWRSLAKVITTVSP